MADQFRYDKAAGVLWLDERYATDLVFVANGAYWVVGDRQVGESIASADAALRAAQAKLRAARDVQVSHVDRAMDAMDAAMTAAGVSLAAPG